jgi:hypothetical protein
MAAVKWIKMIVGMFDGMSFKKIKRARIGGESYRDKLTAVWFELLDLAARCNHNGALVATDGLPFTDLEDLAIQIDRDEDELKLCMTFYLKERMVTIEEDTYSISNWGVYQNVDGMEKIRESKRLAQAKWRAKQKALPHVDATVDSTRCLVDDAEEEGEEDKELEQDIENERKNEISFAQPTERDFDMFSTEFSTGEDAKRKMLGGELGKGVVFLSDWQIDDLLEKLSIEEFDYYVGVVADCILKGKPFKRKTHYQAILDMALADRKLK